MGINKFGASQQMRDYTRDNAVVEEKKETKEEGTDGIYLQDSTPEFSPAELEVLEALDKLCVQKGVSQDLLVDKLFKYKK